MPVVEVDVDAHDAEVAADALWQAGPSAVSEIDLGAGRVRLTADVADLAGLSARLSGRWSARVIEPDSAAHLDEWRAWATPQRAGRHVVVQPAWLTPVEVGDEDLVVRIDPGRTFGSASHPSTRLVLAVLEDRITGGEHVLDVGCGSGVLAVAACLLGASAATALDIDPVAVEVTRANAGANGVADQVEAATTPVADQPGRFDVVVANIGARVLRELAPHLCQRLAPGGLLVLAGLLEEQCEQVVAAYPTCLVIDQRADDGWVVLVLRA